jgi:hypothetical protein
MNTVLLAQPFSRRQIGFEILIFVETARFPLTFSGLSWDSFGSLETVNAFLHQGERRKRRRTPAHLL